MENHLKRFSRVARRERFVLISVLAALVITLVVLVLIDLRSGLRAHRPRESLGDMNRVVSALHDYQTSPKSQTENALESAVAVARRSMPAAGQTEELRRVFTNPLDRIVASSAEEVVVAVGKTAAVLNDDYFERQDLRYAVLAGYFAAMAVVGSLLIGFSAGAQRRYRGFLSHAGESPTGRWPATESTETSRH